MNQQPTAHFLKPSEVIKSFNEILEDNNLPFTIQRIFTENNSYPVLLYLSSNRNVESSVGAIPVVQMTMNFKITDNIRNFDEVESYMDQIFPILHQENEALALKLINTNIHALEIINVSDSYTITEKDSLVHLDFSVAFRYQQET